MTSDTGYTVGESGMIFEIDERNGPVRPARFRPQEGLLPDASGDTTYFVEAEVNGTWHACGFMGAAAGFITSAKRDVFLSQLRSGSGRGALMTHADGPQSDFGEWRGLNYVR